MKKYLLSLIIVLFSLELLNAQQYVVTTPTNKNVLLEEYTGNYCTYCPNGHRIANELAAKYPGRVFPINIHAGSFASTSYPNMTTTQGNEYNNNFGVTSYPTGILNRVGQIGYTQWENKVDEMMKENAIVNIAGDYTINAATRTVQITVEMYYTGNSSESTNYLTIYMLQDDIVGYQAGSNLNPTQIVDGQYNHTHVFRSAITSTWGDAVSPTTAGSLITKTYTYTIPQSIGSPNGVDVDLNKVYFVAFLTEKNEGSVTRPVLNSCKLGEPSPNMYVVDLCYGESYTEHGFNYNKPAAGYYEEIKENNDGSYSYLYLTVYPSYTRNLEMEICEGESFHYGAFHFDNPEAGVHTQENVLKTVDGCDSTIVMTLTVYPSYNIELTAEICEGEDYKENGFNLNNLSAGVHNESLEFETDFDCDSIVNLVLTVHETPEVTISGNTNIYSGEGATLTASGADSYLWSTGETTASITVYPTATATYSVVGTTNGCDDEAEVTVNVTVGVGENELENTKVYPNPTNGELKIECLGMREISVFMPNGQCVENIYVNDDAYTLNMSEYKSGVYYVKITTKDNAVKVCKSVKM